MAKNLDAMSWLIIIVLLLIIVSSSFYYFAAAPPPAAGKPAAGTLSVAVVDMERLMGQKSEWEKWRQLNGQFREFAGAKLKELSDRRDRIFKVTGLLTEEEEKELDFLESKASPTEQDKQRITELRQLTTQRNEELTRLEDLESKGQISEEDKRKLNELRERANKRIQALKEFEEKIRTDIAKKDHELSTILRRDRDTILEQLAKSKNLSLILPSVVFTKVGNQEIPLDLVLYSSPEADITNELLQRLNAIK